MLAQKTALDQLRETLQDFTNERNWGQFHTPKNLASALSVEVAELLEPFQWLKTGERDELGEEAYAAVRYEMADVLNYLVMLADHLHIDLIASAHEKIKLNAEKYPVQRVQGDSRKYSAYSKNE